MALTRLTVNPSAHLRSDGSAAPQGSMQVVACGPGLLRAWRPTADGALIETPILHPKREAGEQFTDICWFRDKTLGAGGGSGDPYGAAAKRNRERRLAALTADGRVLLLVRSDVETPAEAIAAQKAAALSGGTDRMVVPLGNADRGAKGGGGGAAAGPSGGGGGSAAGGTGSAAAGGNAAAGEGAAARSIAGEMWEVRATVRVTQVRRQQQQKQQRWLGQC